MNIEFLKPAWSEFIEAVTYYDDRRKGLGAGFSAEVQVTVERIVQYPEA